MLLRADPPRLTRLQLDLHLPVTGLHPPALRQGRAIGWIEHALEPLRRSHPAVDVHGLAVAIRSATGIESLIWLVDIAGQSRAEATETVRRTARALLDAALR